MKGIRSLTPQPEDPERSLDLAFEEDPDIKVELIDGVFHQLSIDNALVAITADYPGISPVSQVTVPQSWYHYSSRLISNHCISMVFHRRCL